MTKIIGTKLKMTRLFKEDRAFGVTPFQVESESNISAAKIGALAAARGITKGKGFQGTVKRHGFSGGPKTHGQKNRHRAPGSIGNTTPQRVLPGRRMAGHMGAENITVKNLRIVNIDIEKKIIHLHGAVPGAVGTKIELSI